MGLVTAPYAVLFDQVPVGLVQGFRGEGFIMAKQVDKAWMVADAQQRVLNAGNGQSLVRQVAPEKLLGGHDSVAVAQIIKRPGFPDREALRAQHVKICLARIPHQGVIPGILQIQQHVAGHPCTAANEDIASVHPVAPPVLFVDIGGNVADTETCLHIVRQNIVDIRLQFQRIQFLFAGRMGPPYPGCIDHQACELFRSEEHLAGFAARERYRL
ncbi:MAG: hypothetical protein BWY09_03107 [Candidatus Hydrogenedentes bacterium ADurb.Bin179]|nr:MAG: hypothetical protein BWY09_03107 [Candidatus Hydrogenedentes bacterium ADurb.Bin179]